MSKHPWPCSPFVEVHAERPRPLRRWSLAERIEKLIDHATRHAHAHDDASLAALRAGDPDGAARYAAAADRADHAVGRWRARQTELEKELRGERR